MLDYPLLFLTLSFFYKVFQIPEIPPSSLCSICRVARFIRLGFETLINRAEIIIYHGIN
jgi:hypothetical protein